MNHCAQNLFTSTPYASSTSDIKSLLFHQGYALSETKIQIYKVPHQNIQIYIPVATIILPTAKVEHPFYVENNNLRKHPVNFKGC